MYCICDGKTRQGLFRISSVGSGTVSFFSSGAFSSFSSFLSSFLSPSAAGSAASVLSAADALASGFFSSTFGVASFASAGSSTSIMSLARSLGAIESAVDPTIVVPCVAATDPASPPKVDALPGTEIAEALSSTSTSMLVAFFASVSFSFFSFKAFALAAVDSTAVAAFACSSFFGGVMASGYAKSEGFALHFSEKFLGIFSFSFKPTKAVGVSVNENM
mmetsp:Transcript_105948/g.192772  ORF Transcript_105948/g.192772 Transcript_105948/m.192772 type:complete len:219 (+) Transcript_105948:334-990(+)